MNYVCQDRLLKSKCRNETFRTSECIITFLWFVRLVRKNNNARDRRIHCKRIAFVSLFCSRTIINFKLNFFSLCCVASVRGDDFEICFEKLVKKTQNLLKSLWKVKSKSFFLNFRQNTIKSYHNISHSHLPLGRISILYMQKFIEIVFRGLIEWCFNSLYICNLSKSKL